MKTFLFNKYHQHKETIQNFIWRCLQIFGKQGLSFVIFVFCAKMLNPFDFGVYNYVLAIIFFMTIFGDFGISTATSKYIAEYKITSQEKMRSVLFNSGIIISLITLLITFLVIFFGKEYLHDKYIYALYLLPLIFLSPITSLYDGVYRGLKRFKSLAIISLSVGIFSLSFVYLLVKQYGLIGALLSQSIFYFLLFIVLAIGYGTHYFSLNKAVAKEIGFYSLKYGVAVFGNYLFIRAGILILGHYNFILQIGTYELLNKIFTILILPFIILGQVIAPNFTLLQVENKFDVIFKKLKKYSIIFIIVGTFLGILSYAILPKIIEIFFKDYYNNLFLEMLPWVCVMYALNVFAATIDFGILVPIGFAGLMSKFYIVLGVIGVILSLIMINLFGYIGVIYSFVISSAAMVIGMRLMFFLKLKKLANTNK